MPAYRKAKIPQGQLQLGLALGQVIQAYCTAQGIPYEEDQGENFFERLQAEAIVHHDDTMTVMAQRMWTSMLELQGREFCYILNDAVRADRDDNMAPFAKIARAINQLCVSMPPRPPFPPNDVCFRGGGFDESFRDFFAPGRQFRQPAFLATSFSEQVARRFISRSPMATKILWRVRIDAQHKCRHVNLVRNTNVPGEDEYLFAPYSAFKVVNASWRAGTNDQPHEVELYAAIDNQWPREDLPLAPWS